MRRPRREREKDARESFKHVKERDEIVEATGEQRFVFAQRFTFPHPSCTAFEFLLHRDNLALASLFDDGRCNRPDVLLGRVESLF